MSRHLILDGTIGRADGGLYSADNQPHQIHNGREQQRPLVLQLGVLNEEPVQRFGRKGVLHQGARHDGDRTLLRKPTEHSFEIHGSVVWTWAAESSRPGDKISPVASSLYHNQRFYSL